MDLSSHDMPRTAISLAGIMIISMVALTAVPGGTAATSDDWPGCNDAQMFTEGEFEGELQSSSDTDAMGFRLSPGEYLKLTMEFPERAGEPNIYLQTGSLNNNFLRDETDVRGAINVGTDRDGAVLNPRPGETAEIEIWGVEPLDWMCLKIEDRGWETSYEWELTVERSNPDVELYDVRQLEDRVVELRGEMEQKDQRIDELESELAEKEDEIEALEEEVAELEDESGNADVTIDVSVEPADQATFQVGGEMRVKVDTDGAAPSDVALDFAGQQYTPSDGEAVIPLESAGTQDLSIKYEDTTEVVTLDVAADEEATDDDTPADADDQTGFGFIAALLALAGLLLLSRRQ